LVLTASAPPPAMSLTPDGPAQAARQGQVDQALRPGRHAESRPADRVSGSDLDVLVLWSHGDVGRLGQDRADLTLVEELAGLRPPRGPRVLGRAGVGAADRLQHQDPGLGRLRRPHLDRGLGRRRLRRRIGHRAGGQRQQHRHDRVRQREAPAGQSVPHRAGRRVQPSQIGVGRPRAGRTRDREGARQTFVSAAQTWGSRIPKERTGRGCRRHRGPRRRSRWPPRSDRVPAGPPMPGPANR